MAQNERASKFFGFNPGNDLCADIVEGKRIFFECALAEAGKVDGDNPEFPGQMSSKFLPDMMIEREAVQ